MKVISRIKKLGKERLISLVLLLIIIFTSISFIFIFTLAPVLIIETIGTMQLPSGYFLNDLDPNVPKLELSFSITNKVFTDITDFSIHISEEIVYYENDNIIEKRITIFEKKINFGTIPLFNWYSNNFIGSYDDFDIASLTNFNNNANKTREITIFLNLYVSGSVLNNLVHFRILIGNICASCLY